MRVHHVLAILAATSALLVGPAAAFDGAQFTRAKQALQAAVSTFRATELIKARAQFEALAAAEPRLATLQYWVAYADWRLVPALQGSDREKAQRYLKDGLDRCDVALKLDSAIADAMALKGSLQGLSFTFDPKSAMTVGLQSQINLHRSAYMQPRNPRIWLLEAMNVLHKPAEFGGGAAAADSVFRQAIALYSTSEAPSDPAAPDWGRDDVYLWAGRCATQLNDFSRARDLYREALRVNPANAWVRDSLLPEAEKALAEKPSNP